MINPPDNRLPNGVSFINSLIYDYKRRCKRKGLNFNLDYDSFKNLILQNCHYCGQEPSNLGRKTNLNNRLIKRFNGQFNYNGIDRVNNDLGYSLDNVVPCCKLCNTMKFTLSKKQFLKQIQRIIFSGVLK